MKKIIALSFILSLFLTLFSWISVEGVVYEEGWGGTIYHGYPFKYYKYGVGDVVFGNEWLHGAIIWQGLILDILVWSLFSLLTLIVLSNMVKTAKRNILESGDT